MRTQIPVLTAILVLFGLGCDLAGIDSVESTDLTASQAYDAVGKRGNERSTICHTNSNGRTIKLALPAAAILDHLAHGDSRPGEPVPGDDGAVFSEDCIPIPAVPTRGLVAYYPFSGSADDFSGNGLHASLVNVTFAPDRSGDEAAAAYFGGYASYVQLPWGLLAGEDWDDGFSVSWWQQADFVSGFRAVWRLEEERAIQAFYDEEQFGDGMCVALYNAPWRAVCDAEPQSEWVHYAFVFDGLGMRLYRNSLLIDQDEIPAIDGPASPFGNRVSGSGTPSADFLGRIDEYRLYSRPLSESEVNVLSAVSKPG